MSATAGATPARRNAAVAVLSGAAVVLVVVLGLVLAPGRGGPAAGAGVPSVTPTRSTATTQAPPAPVPEASPSPPVTSLPPPAAPSDPAPTGTTSGTATPPSPPTVVPPPTPPDGAVAPSALASPAPAWLGTRALAPAGSGPVGPQATPPELLDRRLVTVDVRPPPVDGTFAPVMSEVPGDVLARSTWQPSCPVVPDELRYVLVQHWGFDGRLHTGEVVVHADAVEAVVGVFAAMHETRFPLEEVRVIRADELDAAPTGDGNVTSAFVCRPSVGGGGWSRHAYGRALDVNPFHNPYDRGSGEDRLVLPELATGYTDRDRRLPGMLDAGSAAVVAAEAAGWGWGGRWSSAKDWMHLSDDGR